jgi:hypothetical protein
VTRPGDVFTAGTILDGEGSFGDHLTSIRTKDVNTEDAVSLSISDKLDETFSFKVGLGTRVGAEWEVANAVLDAGSLDFSFVLANPGDFGMGVHDARDSSVVDVSVALLDVFDGGDSFFFGLVSEHRAKGAVTDHTDMGSSGAVLLVDHEPALLIDLKTGILKL